MIPIENACVAPFLSICAIVKNEADYIYEWLAYHYAVGVERFFIFDNGSNDDTLVMIKSWPNSNLVTVIDWPYEAGQVPAYREMITAHRDASEWCAFIDIDEFLCPKGHLSVPDVLRSLPPDCGALYVHWLMFGSSGFETKQPGLVTETFIKRGFNGFPPNRLGKTVLRLREAKSVNNSHLLHTHTRTLNDSGVGVQETEAQDTVSHTQIALHHYFCKSREEWRIRRSLGRVSKPSSDPDFIRPDRLFENHDVNQVSDDAAAKIMQYARLLAYR
jgi:O-antigen biosynthesis protein